MIGWTVDVTLINDGKEAVIQVCFKGMTRSTMTVPVNVAILLSQEIEYQIERGANG